MVLLVACGVFGMVKLVGGRNSIEPSGFRSPGSGRSQSDRYGTLVSDCANYDADGDQGHDSDSNKGNSN